MLVKNEDALKNDLERELEEKLGGTTATMKRPASPGAIYVDPYDKPFKPSPTKTVISHSEKYDTLAGVLQDAYEQAASGKGNDRHADGKPFTSQPILEIARMLNGIDGHAFQMMKKAQEAARMIQRNQSEAAVQELFGIINYAAAAVILIREK